MHVNKAIGRKRILEFIVGVEEVRYLGLLKENGVLLSWGQSKSRGNPNWLSQMVRPLGLLSNDTGPDTWVCSPFVT